MNDEKSTIITKDVSLVLKIDLLVIKWDTMVTKPNNEEAKLKTKLQINYILVHRHLYKIKDKGVAPITKILILSLIR